MAIIIIATLVFYSKNLGDRAVQVVSDKVDSGVVESSNNDEIEKFTEPKIVSYGNYRIKTGNGFESVVFQGQEGKKYDEIVKQTVQTSVDSQVIIYAAKNYGGDGSTREEFVVVNNNEVSIFPIVDIFHLALSNNGQDFAFIASVRDENNNFKYLSSFNNKQGKPYDDIDGKNFIFGPDGSRIAYIAKNASKNFVVVQSAGNYKEGPLQTSPIRSDLHFSGDSLIYRLENGVEEVLNFGN